MSDGKVEYEITGDASGLAGAARGASNSLAGIGVAGVAMTSVLGAAIAAVTAAATGMAMALKESANFEVTKTGIRTLVKDAQLANSVMKELSDLAADTPMGMDQLAPAARGLLAGGTAAKDLTKELMVLGDIASGAQTDLQGLVLVLNQVRGVGKLMGGDFLQMQQKGVGGLREELAKIKGIEINELAKAIEKGTVSADDFFQALKNSTSAGGLFFNAMKNDSETLVGRISTLKDNFAELLRIPGDRLLPPAKAFVETLSGGIKSAIDGANLLGETIKVAAKNGQVGELFALSLQVGIVKGLSGAFNLVKGALGSIGQFLADQIVNGIAQAINPVLKMLGQELIPVDDTISAGVMSFWQNIISGWTTAEDRLNAMLAAGKSGLEDASNGLGDVTAKGAEKVEKSADKLKDILNKGTGEKKDGDRDGDGIISKREQRRLDLDQKRAERRANSAKGFSFDKAGLGGFGGLDEFFALQFRDGADGTGFEGERAFSAFGDRRRGVASASQVGRASRIFNGVEAADMAPRDAAFRRINEGRNAGVNNTGNTGEQGNLSALEAILLELKRIRTR